LNPERRQRGDGSHQRRLHRVVEVVRRCGWGTAMAHILKPRRLPAARSTDSTPAAGEASGAAPPRRAGAGLRGGRTPAAAVLSLSNSHLRRFVAPARTTAISRF